MPQEFEEISELDDLDEVGSTSAEGAEDAAAHLDVPIPSSRQTQARELLRQFTIYDGMLVVSLVCITLATFLMVWELSTFGRFPGFVWRVDEVVVQPIGNN